MKSFYLRLFCFLARNEESRERDRGDFYVSSLPALLVVALITRTKMMIIMLL